MNVSFITQCYEGDFKNVLSFDRLKKSIDNHNFNFYEKILIINISKNYNNIIDLASKAIDNKILSNFYLVEDYLDEISKFFQIEEEDFKSQKSWYINLYNLASIYLCKSEFLAFYTGDSVCIKNSNWIKNSIKLLSENNHCLSTNQNWSEFPIVEYFSEDDNFYYSNSSFSDQNYFIRKNDFMSPDIIKYKSKTKKFPHGDTFEMRIFGYMEKYNKLRAICKNGHYRHANF